MPASESTLGKRVNCLAAEGPGQEVTTSLLNTSGMGFLSQQGTNPYHSHPHTIQNTAHDAQSHAPYKTMLQPCQPFRTKQAPKCIGRRGATYGRYTAILLAWQTPHTIPCQPTEKVHPRDTHQQSECLGLQVGPSHTEAQPMIHLGLQQPHRWPHKAAQADLGQQGNGGTRRHGNLKQVQGWKPCNAGKAMEKGKQQLPRNPSRMPTLLAAELARDEEGQDSAIQQSLLGKAWVKQGMQYGFGHE